MVEQEERGFLLVVRARSSLDYVATAATRTSGHYPLVSVPISVSLSVSPHCHIDRAYQLFSVHMSSKHNNNKHCTSEMVSAEDSIATRGYQMIRWRVFGEFLDPNWTSCLCLFVLFVFMHNV